MISWWRRTFTQRQLPAVQGGVKFCKAFGCHRDRLEFAHFRQITTARNPKLNAQKTITLETQGRSILNITDAVQSVVAQSDVHVGICQVFIHHTSASLMLCENADPDVLRDLETFMARLVPDGDPEFRHSAEGPDDMPAHVRSVLTHTGVDIPVSGARCDLGTWQGLYLWEHRYRAHRREITVSLSGA